MENQFTWHEYPQPEQYLHRMFDTFDDAKTEGETESEEKEFYVSEIIKRKPCLTHGDSLVERLVDDWTEDDAFWGDDEYLFLGEKWKEPLKELQQEFDRVIGAWAEKHNITTEFRCYKNINETKIELKKETP